MYLICSGCTWPQPLLALRGRGLQWKGLRLFPLFLPSPAVLWLDHAFPIVDSTNDYTSYTYSTQHITVFCTSLYAGKDLLQVLANGSETKPEVMVGRGSSRYLRLHFLYNRALLLCTVSRHHCQLAIGCVNA